MATLTETDQEWIDWVSRDPTPLRVGLALTRYNLANGPAAIIEMLRRYDADRSTIAHLALVYEVHEFFPFSTRDEVIAKYSRYHAEGWDVMTEVETQFAKGRYQKQLFAPTSAFEDEGANLKARMDRGPEPKSFGFIRGFLDLRRASILDTVLKGKLRPLDQSGLNKEDQGAFRRLS
jgi:hypothetical protein